MVWLLLAGLVVLGIRAGRARPRRRRSELGVGPSDVAELDAIARRVTLEHFTPASSALIRHLRLIQARGVPARRVEATCWPRRWYLGFADGTDVVIAADDPTAVVALRVSLSSGAVRLRRVDVVSGGVELEFAGGLGRHRVLAVADA